MVSSKRQHKLKVTTIHYNEQAWMTDKIINGSTKKKISEAKGLWMREKCEELVQLQRNHDCSTQKIQGVIALKLLKRNTPIKLTYRDGHVLSSEDEVMNERENYNL